MTWQLLIDETEAGSLALLERLAVEAETVDRVGDGDYKVTGNKRAVEETIERYPDAVLKVELI
jgi:hypothetical protein